MLRPIAVGRAFYNKVGLHNKKVNYTMTGQKSNISKCDKRKKVEKLQPKLFKEPSGFVQISNDTLNGIDNAEVLGVYCYLAGRPPEWIICKTHLRNYFKLGINKIDTIFTKLRRLGLLEVIPRKNEKGKIDGWDYYLKLHINVCEKSTPMDSMPMDSIPMENNPYINKENINKEEIKDISESGDSPAAGNDDFVQQVVDAYHDKLPEMPKIKIITDEVKKAVKILKKEWGNIKGVDLTIERISKYFEGRRELTPWILEPYKTQQGNYKRSRLINIIRIDNVRKFYNGDYNNG